VRPAWPQDNLKYGVYALVGQQGYSMNDTISRADVLNVRLKDINFEIFFDLTGEGIRIVEGGDHLFTDIDWIPVFTPTPHGAMRVTCWPIGTEPLANHPADVSIRTIINDRIGCEQRMHGVLHNFLESHGSYLNESSVE